MKTAKTDNLIYVVTGRFQDRHGDEGLNGPELFSTIDKAAKYLAEQAEEFIKYHNGLHKDGTIDYDTVDSIDDDQGDTDDSILAAKDILPYVQKNHAIDINIDGEGTWSNWEIFYETVQ